MRYRWWILITSCLFGFGFVVGLAFTLVMPAGVMNIFSEELAALQKLGEMFHPFQFQTAGFIFAQNVSTLLLSFLFSPVLCLLPVLALLFNGVLLGFVSVIAAQHESVGFVLGGLLPHGIVELPALVMGEAAALSFGAMVMVLLIRHGWSLITSFIREGGVRILLILVLFTIVGIFPTIIILALMNEQTRPIFMENIHQSAKYLVKHGW